MSEPTTECPPGCADEHTFSGSCALRWMGPAWEQDGARWVRDEDGRPAAAQHLHTPADVAFGTVMLCATRTTPDGGLRWAHMPVDRWLWGANEAFRDTFREEVRREVGDPAAPVEVVEAGE
ncbi:hypothetical protein ACFWNQ_15210 [Streptomyces virginiae]|uniref:hypothetical protein n=1 Tax=Streptomyces virginiae TaxID=1961 RepID=UPI003649F05B